MSMDVNGRQLLFTNSSEVRPLGFWQIPSGQKRVDCRLYMVEVETDDGWSLPKNSFVTSVEQCPAMEFETILRSRMFHRPATCSYGIETSGNRSTEYEVIVTFNKRNQGSSFCIHWKATPHAVVAVKISAYNFPVPEHLIQNCHIKVIVTLYTL